MAVMDPMDDYDLVGLGDYPGFQLGNLSHEDFLRVSQDYMQDDSWLPKSEEVVFVLLFVLLMVLGLLGNGLVCFIVIRKGRRQSSRNWYVLNLAVSDILTCAFCQPLTLVRILRKDWTLGAALCGLVPCLQTVYVLVSTLTLVALAVDRYRSITGSTDNTGRQYRLATSSLSSLWCCVLTSPFCCLVLIWLASVCVALPVALFHYVEPVRLVGGFVLYTLCVEEWPNHTQLVVYTTFMLVSQYLLPLAAIVVLHLLIGHFLRMRITSEVACRLPDVQWRRKLRRHRKNMWLLTSMAVSFAVAWLPLHIVNALVSVDHKMFQSLHFPLLHASCMIVAFSSVCLNPVIYGLLNSNFRRDLRRLLCLASVGNGASAGGSSFCTSGQGRRKSSSRNTEQCALLATSASQGGGMDLSVLMTPRPRESTSVSHV